MDDIRSLETVDLSAVWGGGDDDREKLCRALKTDEIGSAAQLQKYQAEGPDRWRDYTGAVRTDWYNESLDRLTGYRDGAKRERRQLNCPP
jgi:hypothetical protein